MYVASGEWRSPRRGEFYLSGSIIAAYRACNDLTTNYWIAILESECRELASWFLEWRMVSGAIETVTGIPIARMERETGNGTLPVERDENCRRIVTLHNQAIGIKS
jgi:hypothetical protein